MFTPTITEANLMIVLDKSSSMLETVEGTSKWEAAVAAIKQVMTQYPAIHFGLEMFSVPSEGLGTNCTEGPGKIYVPIAANTQEEIASSMVSADGQGTPIAGGLVVGGADPALLDPTRTEGVIVVTDGQENCHGDPVDEVAKLLARPVSVKTWVVGFGSAVDPRTLSSMAQAGGTARPGDPRYYQADAPADLVAALSAIARSATCSFTLTQAPPDPAQVNIVINGQSVPRDPTHTSGWDYDPATNRVTLYGAACQGLGNAGGTGGSSAAQIGVQFACASGGGGADDTAPATDPVPVPVPRPDDD